MKIPFHISVENCGTLNKNRNTPNTTSNVSGPNGNILINYMHIYIVKSF